jgi:hypothetical protein
MLGIAENSHFVITLSDEPSQKGGGDLTQGEVTLISPQALALLS